MTEIDTSREAELHADFFDPSRGYCVLFSTYTALLDRAEKAEAERDTAWNDAIEAVKNSVLGLCKDRDLHRVWEDDRIRGYFEACGDTINALITLRKARETRND